ncbi:MAG TPA: cellulase family glycosylhydrolase, partial [Candidatus Ratteibacteria bacterium]|nr:cellulase family glycosylhydrolase [Candidatus Ratteibacteria bacterium]
MELGNKRYSYVRGFNYQPSYGSCGFEIWHNFDSAKIKKEIYLGKRYFPGINTLRIWLSWDAYLRDKEKFKNNFDIVLDIIEDLDLKIIPVLFNAWQGFPYFGGVSYEHIRLYKNNPSYYKNYFITYLEDIVGSYQNDKRILLWDLCNEPSTICQTEESRKVVFEFLFDIYNFCKKEIKVISPISVGIVPSIHEIELYEPISDIITTHPYWARNQWVKDKNKFKEFLDNVVKFANLKEKGVIATETGWGSLDDYIRVETLEFELIELKKR